MHPEAQDLKHKNFSFISPESIIIQRDDRQRREIDTNRLKESIAINGILNPIIVSAELVLVAGERRLTAALELGLPLVPVRFLDTLSEIEQKIIELEENIKRSELSWQDEVRAVAALHETYAKSNLEWSISDTAEALAENRQYVQKRCKVAEHMHNPKISTAVGITAALNIILRAEARAADNAFSDIMDGVGAAYDDGPDGAPDNPHTAPIDTTATPTASAPAGTSPHKATPQAQPAALAPPPESILCESFLDWAPAYTGPKFNFIHCDFPYGVNVFDGEQGASGTKPYDDSEETYWTLLECFCKNLDNFMAHSAHMMFWFSMKHYEKTLDFFSTHAPSLAFNKFPLVWVKSDNKGILPDHKRGPRQIYETCLIASREDRLIIKATSNAYSSPTDRTYHESTKPEPMLAYFMSMFVDQTTSLLDPTCGGGSALRAAERLGARRTLGLEMDPASADNARVALRKARILARGSAV